MWLAHRCNRELLETIKQQRKKTSYEKLWKNTKTTQALGNWGPLPFYLKRGQNVLSVKICLSLKAKNKHKTYVKLEHVLSLSMF